MREKKYRAYSERDGMEYFDDLYWFEENGVHDLSGEGHYAKYTIMEYIERKDKKGKALYENDIIKWVYPGFAGEYGPGIIGRADFPGVSGFAVLDGKGDLHKDFSYNCGWGLTFESYTEKIGNICENKELLEAKNETD